jgi:alginate O-acetyltransferase complex protein AlgJ
MERLDQIREEEARRELGATSVAPRVARTLALAFLVSIASIPVLQLAAAPGAADWRKLVSGVPTECSLRAFEGELEEVSWAGRRLRPRTQEVLTRFLGAGNEQVHVGRGGWLFHWESVASVTGPGFLDPARQRARRRDADACEPTPEPDPLPALFAFHEELASRGIRLVVMPTPVKASIEPQRVSGAPRRRGEPVRNVSYREFRRALEEYGVQVFDPGDVLLSLRDRRPERSLFLATDTHWRPGTVEAVAEALAKFLLRHVELSPPDRPLVRRPPRRVRNRGDVAAMLGLAHDDLYPPEEVTIRSVREADGAPWRPQPGADVLLLGDSFSNVYSSRGAFARRAGSKELHWGEGAGLAEQLAFALRRPVDRIVRNAAGAHATRAELARAMARGRDRLTGVRVVVWQFAERELAFGDWRRVALPSPSSDAIPVARPIQAESGALRRVRGTIVARAPLPEPRALPYADVLFAVRLAQVEMLPGEEVGGEMLVYLSGIRDNARTPQAGFRAGQEVVLDVVPWETEQVQDELGSLSRVELEDPDALFLPAFWGAPVR